MPENYPTSLDDLTSLPHHAAGQVIPSAGWNDIVDALIATETKLGLFTGNGLPNTVATFGMSGTLFTQTGQGRWYAERKYTLTAVRASVGTPSTSGSVIIQVNTATGNTATPTAIFSASAPDDRPAITQGNYRTNTTNLTAGPPAVALGVAIAANAFLTVDVAAVGTGSADLTVQLILTPA